MQIPKAQKDSQLKQLFALLGSMSVKAARKHVDEIDPMSPYFPILFYFKCQTACIIIS